MSTMNREAIESVVRSLRRVNLQGSLFGQTVAVRFGLSESDVETLEALIDVGATTAGRLSELTGLTSGAVTRVIDRLEQAGYVRRVPDPGDRRRVIVEVDPQKSAAIQAALGRLGSASAKEIGRYTEAQLALIDDFLTRMAEITHDEATTLRENPEPDPDEPTTAERAAPVGGLTSARLLIRSGFNELTLRSAGDLIDLYRARFEGVIPEVRLRGDTVSLRYKGGIMPWDWRKRVADLTLNDSIPWTIQLAGAANRFTAELPRLDLRLLELTGGADTLRLSLARPTGLVPIRLIGGASKVRVERPAGVPIRLTVSGGAGGVEFDRQKLGGMAGQIVLESDGAANPADRYSIEVTGGLGQIVVREASR
jgi:DNA-binding MarR family transcriptional regulator